MDKLDLNVRFSKAGAAIDILIREREYDVVEFVINRMLLDDEGFIESETRTEMYPSYSDFKKIWSPIVNKLKEKFDADKTTEQRGE